MLFCQPPNMWYHQTSLTLNFLKFILYNLVTYWICNALFICKPKTKFEGAKIFFVFQPIFLEKLKLRPQNNNQLYSFSENDCERTPITGFCYLEKPLKSRQHKNHQTNKQKSDKQQINKQTNKQTEQWQPCYKSQPL